MRVPINWLHVQAFCEYQIYLAHVKGAKAGLPIKQEALDGRMAHEALHDAEIATSDDLTSSIEELSTKAATGIISSRREVLVKGKRCIGSIDEVQITKEYVFIIDDKPNHAEGEPAHYGDMRQVQAYGLAFRETYNVPLPITVVIRDRDTGKWAWQKLLTRKDVEEVNATLDRIFNILDESQPAMPTRNPKKCARCEWRMVCDKCAVVV